VDDGPGPDAVVTEVLAGTADEVTDAVTRLIGLTYEHFTTCVVLPQGEVQRFLHQKPATRQDLLIELLDLGVYGAMATEARARTTEIQHQRSWVGQQLGELADFTVHRQAMYETARAELEKLLEVVDEVGPVLEQLAARSAAARTEAQQLAARAEALAGMAVPADVRGLADELRVATAAAAEARGIEAEAAAALSAAEAVVEALPERTALDAQLRAHEERVTEGARVAKGVDKVAAAQQVERDARAALEAAQAAHRLATEARLQAQTEHAAHALAATVVVGQPCPVCHQVVEVLPTIDLADLDALAVDERSAAGEVAAATERHRTAVATRDRFEVLLADLRARVDELDARLANAPSADEAQAQLAGIDEAHARVRAARGAEQKARAGCRAAEGALDQCRSAEQAAWRRFDAARDSVAPLGPPTPGRADLALDWTALVAWADHERPAAEAAAAETAARAAAADAEADRRRREVEAACTEAGVDTAGRPVRDVVIERLADARADLDSLVAGLARADDLRRQDAELAEREQVAALLAAHLRSNAFEKWFLDDVLVRLVATATAILHDLSGGGYSLSSDARGNFSVIDHANADAVRSVRTLSGGETFLASLALALALADEVAQLSTTGSVHLESIFLDEGFGTLDADTLDIVATAIEELGARGRMVGLVTHVRDLAERLPVRYDIVRHGNTSTVTRTVP
jgi:exonuclease SbcC